MSQPATVPVPVGQAGSMDGLAQTVLAQISADVSATRAEVGQVSTRLVVIEATAKTADEWRRDVEARVRVLEARQAPADLDSRLRALERFRYTLGGLAIAGGTLAGWVGEWLAQHVHG